jgi:hypothetical protein
MQITKRKSSKAKALKAKGTQDALIVAATQVTKPFATQVMKLRSPRVEQF